MTASPAAASEELSGQSGNSGTLTPAFGQEAQEAQPLGLLTCQREENIPITVPGSHRCCQVTGVAAAVGAGHVVQADAVGGVQQDRRRPPRGAVVQAGGSVREISGQEPHELILLADL